jgi:hypothetical protein
MGYFGAGVGGRVNAIGTSAPTEHALGVGAANPLFAAALGARPQPEKASPVPAPTATPGTPACPLCSSDTERTDGLIGCVGRCRARWLEDGTGRLIDVAALPFGVCSCCTPRRALAGAEWGAICPASGKGYLLLAGGPALVETAAPDGLCTCCAPPAPLVWEEERLVCSRKRDRIYQHKGGNGVTASETEKPNIGTQSEFIQAVDAALHANSAQLTVFGLFDIT